MEYRPLDITVISAENLKDVNLISKMDVYVEVSIGGNPVGKRKTHVNKDGGKNPEWNHRLKFDVGVDVLAANPALTLLFKIRSYRPLGDKDIGEVSVPIKELLLLTADGGERVAEYQVRTPSGKPKGTLKFSYKFGDKLTAPAEPPPPKSKNTGGEAVTAYPAHPGPSATYPPPVHVGYAQPYAAGHAPSQPGYGYPPPQPGYGAPPPAPGYGHPAQGYGYPPVQAAVQKPKKKSNLGLGLAGGLLGGLLVGDMISDVGDMSGCDGGFDF